jgi:hypothetical protein
MAIKNRSNRFGHDNVPDKGLALFSITGRIVLSQPIKRYTMICTAPDPIISQGNVCLDSAEPMRNVHVRRRFQLYVIRVLIRMCLQQRCSFKVV